MKSMILALSRRRALLCGTAAVLVGVAGPASRLSLASLADAGVEAVPFSVSPAAGRRSVARLAAAYRGPEPARLLGDASLGAGRVRASAGSLIESLLGRHTDLHGAIVYGDDAALRQSVRAAVRRDFADGETLVVRGWLLARCEAEICGLICLA